MIWSEESKAKASATHTGTTASDEAKAIMSIAQKLAWQRRKAAQLATATSNGNEQTNV
jgi:hypothetical protein